MVNGLVNLKFSKFVTLAKPLSASELMGSRIGIGFTLKMGKSYYSVVGAIVVSYAERAQGFWPGNTTKHILNVCGRNRDRYHKNREHILLNQKLKQQQPAYKAYLERNRDKIRKYKLAWCHKKMPI
jgi:hypothetical protein